MYIEKWKPAGIKTLPHHPSMDTDKASCKVNRKHLSQGYAAAVVF